MMMWMLSGGQIEPGAMGVGDLNELSALSLTVKDIKTLKVLWGVSLAFLIISIVVGLFCSAIRYFWKVKLPVSFVVCVPVGIFLASFVLMIPMYYFGSDGDNICSGDKLRSILLALQHTMRLFVLDGDYNSFVQILNHWEEGIKNQYANFSLVLYVMAPFVTFGFVMTFIKNLFAYVHYYFSFLKTPHIFSELNEKTLTLAKNIVLDHEKTRYVSWLNQDHKGTFLYGLGVFLNFFPLFFRKPLIVFTDVTHDKEESYLELMDGAREIDAVLFRKDLESIRWRLPLWKRHLKFYLISEDTHERIRHADNIVKRYRDNGVEMYFFSHDMESKFFLDDLARRMERPKPSVFERIPKKDGAKVGKKNNVLVFRIDDVRMLVYQYLHKYGISLFENATTVGGERVIDVAILGLGRYGMEMLKALLWYCQLPGYTIRIRAFEEKKGLKSEFQVRFPDLKIGQRVVGNGKDMNYEIHLRQCSVYSSHCMDELRKLPDKALVFVCLGSDEQNIEAANRIKLLSRGENKNFRITTVVYNTHVKQCVEACEKWDCCRKCEELRVAICNECEETCTKCEECEQLRAEKDEKKRATVCETCQKACVMWKKCRKLSKEKASKEHAETRAAMCEMCEEKEYTVIGDLTSFYSPNTVINSDLCKEALNFHARWKEKNSSEEMTASDIREFYLNEYSVHSSMSKALHFLLRHDIWKRLKESTGEEEKARFREVFPFLFTDDGQDLACWYYYVIEHTVSAVKANHLYQTCMGKIQELTKRDETSNFENTKLRELFTPQSSEEPGHDSRTAGAVTDDRKPVFRCKPKEKKRVFRIKPGVQSMECWPATTEKLRRRLLTIAYAAATLEHIRWNAYVRTEGFRPATNKTPSDKKYKIHNNLGSVDNLTVVESLKDI